jgi:hypothetical protein
VHSALRDPKNLPEWLATDISDPGHSGKLLFLLVYDRLVKKSPRRKKGRFLRGCATLRQTSSTELSTDDVDKGFSPSWSWA